MLIALVLVSILLAHANAQVYRGRLVGGQPDYDQHGQLLGYSIFAEERAIVQPPPVFSVFRDDNLQQLTEPLTAAPTFRPSPPRYAFEFLPQLNVTVPITETASLSLPGPVTTQNTPRKKSLLQWNVSHFPLGAGSVLGSRSVWNVGNQFILGDLVFPVDGRYGISMNVTMYWGHVVRFNITVNVAKQPTDILITSVPEGYNGTEFDPLPSVRLVDANGIDVATTTPLVMMEVIDSPAGSSVSGAGITRSPNRQGSVIFLGNVASLPGEYTLRFAAILTDSSTIYSGELVINVMKALPTQIVLVSTVSGVARFTLTTQPLYEIHDAVGVSSDNRTSLKVELHNQRPSVQYEGISPLAMLSGNTTVFPVNYMYKFTDLAVGLPGSYDLFATLLVDGEPWLTHTERIYISDPPTWEGGPLTVNTVGQLRIVGSRPSMEEIYLTLAKDSNCTQDASESVAWRRPYFEDFSRNISFIPFASGEEMFVCMKLPVQRAAVPLVKFYRPRFGERFPLTYTLSVREVGECADLTSVEAAQYILAGWDSVESGRSYGCQLQPPVAGTIAPCECNFMFACEEFRHNSFQPPGLDIGRCVCCKSWVLAITGTVAVFFVFGLLAVIYKFV